MHFELAKELRMIRADMHVMRLELSRVPMELTVVKTSMLECNRRMDALDAHAQARSQADHAELRNMTAHLEASVQRLAAELEARTQSDLLAFELEVFGVPETKHEDCREIVTAIVRKFGVTLEPRDIARADRCAADTFYEFNRPRNIAVRFTTTYVRAEVLRAARKHHKETVATVGLPGPGSGRKIHIFERLSREKRQLFNRAHLAGRKLGWKFVWTDAGMIFARKENHLPKFRIANEMDLIAVFQSNGPHNPAT